MSEARKLATIMALDIVGYSHAAELDDSSAADSVRRLRQFIAEALGPREGRLFSSAGDGFMLEFSTASDALEAAIDLTRLCGSATPPLPVRIGIHLGEVIVEHDGDLLGHGVNIAARLQQSAKPRQTIVSEEVRRSVRGALARQLRSLGPLRLNKMDETIDVFVFDPSFAPGRRLALARLQRRTWLIGGAALLAGMVALLALVNWPRPASTSPAAVFTFSAPGDASALADGIATEVVTTMSGLGLQPISRGELESKTGASHLERAARLGASYAVDGDIVREGNTVRVTARIDDVQSRQTLWSQSYEREAERAGELRLQTAAAIVIVLRCASDARSERRRWALDLLNALLRTCELAHTRGEEAQLLNLAQRVAQNEPRSSLAQAQLAVARVRASAWATDAMEAQLLDEAIQAADIALRLNPRNGRAAAAKAFAQGARQSWREYEQTLLDLLRDVPGEGWLNHQYAQLLRETGRNEEALEYYRRARADSPLEPIRLGHFAWALALNGRDAEAQELLLSAAVRWPGVSDIWWARFRTAFWFGRRDEALRLLSEAPPESASTASCWRRTAAGLASSAIALRREVAAEAASCLEPTHAIPVMSALGDIDGAFELAETKLRNSAFRPFLGEFFVPETARMRSDPRFMPLMQRAGIVEYWQTSDHWPDFCAEPGLPYDCHEEAIRLTSADPVR
ncbi:MAG: adenylate/guanylate cyclase domain-containing protein [Hyphomonadaceae bacterium]